MISNIKVVLNDFHLLPGINFVAYRCLIYHMQGRINQSWVYCKEPEPFDIATNNTCLNLY
jgi:hypothetical protein